MWRPKGCRSWWGGWRSVGQLEKRLGNVQACTVELDAAERVDDDRHTPDSPFNVEESDTATELLDPFHTPPLRIREKAERAAIRDACDATEAFLPEVLALAGRFRAVYEVFQKAERMPANALLQLRYHLIGERLASANIRIREALEHVKHANTMIGPEVRDSN